MGALLARWGWIEWKRYQTHRLFAQMGADIHRLSVAMGEALIPAVRSAAQGVEALAAALDALPDDVKRKLRAMTP